MTTRVCVLRESTDYGPKHVQWLADQVPGLVCITTTPVPGVPSIDMPHDWPSWWCKMNLFAPGLIDDDLLYFDLDTVVLGDVSVLDRGRTTMLSDFYQPHLPASGLMFIRNADKVAVWDAWQDKPHKHMSRCATQDCWGDQGFLKGVLQAERWQDVLPGKVVSYKAHCRNGPGDALVVCFHGHPRPWQVSAPWIPELE